MLELGRCEPELLVLELGRRVFELLVDEEGRVLGAVLVLELGRELGRVERVSVLGAVRLSYAEPEDLVDLASEDLVAEEAERVLVGAVLRVLFASSLGYGADVGAVRVFVALSPLKIEIGSLSTGVAPVVFPPAIKGERLLVRGATEEP